MKQAQIRVTQEKKKEKKERESAFLVIIQESEQNVDKKHKQNSSIDWDKMEL